MAKQNKTTLTTRIIWILLSAFFLVMVISQLYIHFYNPYRTEVALLYEAVDSVLFKGIFVRDERVVEVGDVGIVAYLHEDGTKIARNSVVAKSYNNRRDILLQNKIENIEQQIDILREAEVLKNTDNSQIESFSNQITNAHSSLMKQLNIGRYDNIAYYKNNYLSLQSKKEIVRGTYVNYDMQIAEHQNEISRLNAQISQLPRNLTIGDAGYFVSKVDGYERLLNTKNVYDLTKDEIEQVIESPELQVSGNAIGKMIDNYKWLFVGILDTEKTRNVFEGATVSMRVGSSSRTVNVTVESVERLDDGTSIIVFQCDQLSSEFLGSRTARFRLMLEDYSGIRIPSSAVRFNENNEQGVFIQSGIEIRFVRINTLLTENNYMVVENTTGQNGFLSLYDLIVVEGKDLYEGKIVYD